MINRYLFYGIAAGFFSALIVIFLSGYFILQPVINRFSSKLGKSIEENLGKPSFPLKTSNPTNALADYRWKCKTLDGKEYDVSQLKGKTAFLNFWATWCPPCVAEMPSLDKLSQKMKNEPVAFLCVSSEDAKTLKDFMEKKKFSLPIYMFDGELPSVFKTEGIPASFIVSPKGEIVFKHIGSANWNDPSSSEFLKRVIKGN